jgi:hypothetical protein
LEYVMDIRDILWPFVTFSVQLVHFSGVGLYRVTWKFLQTCHRYTIQQSCLLVRLDPMTKQFGEHKNAAGQWPIATQWLMQSTLSSAQNHLKKNTHRNLSPNSLNTC